MSLDFLVGWLFLVSSWILPSLIKDREKRVAIGLTLSGIATGIFMGHLLGKIVF